LVHQGASSDGFAHFSPDDGLSRCLLGFGQADKCIGSLLIKSKDFLVQFSASGTLSQVALDLPPRYPEVVLLQDIQLKRVLV
jgi:hypothetical protein